MDLFVGIDIGASEIKVSVFDQDGVELTSAERTCAVETPVPGWAQSPPDVFMKWPVEVLAEALGNINPMDVSTIGVTGSRATIMPIDRDGQAVGPAILWYDRRSAEAAKLLEDILQPRNFFEITGVPLDATPSITKMIWLREHQLEVFQKAAVFVLPQTAVLHSLTGEGWFCDESYGSYFGLMDLSKKRWSRELMHAADISESVLPKLVSPGTVVGTLSSQAAEKLGLKSAIPVVASGSDAACFKLGAGVGAEGIATLHIASAGAVGIISKTPTFDARLTCCPSAIAECWDVDALLLTGGSAYQWVRDLFRSIAHQGIELSFEDLNHMASEVPAGSEGILMIPHLAGAGTPLWSSKASGMILGLRLSHKAGHFARAVLEGIAYAHKQAIRVLEEVVSPIEKLHFTGGGSRSRLWAQIFADVLNIPISIPRSGQSTCLGAAMIAAKATGWFPDYKSTLGRMGTIEREFTPIPSNRFIYERGYRDFLIALERTLDLMRS